MASRSLTEVFLLMRNNCAQYRSSFQDPIVSDRVALVAEEEVELGRVPPQWTSAVEELQYSLVRLKTKIVRLKELQEKVVRRPTLDDDTAEEREIQTMSQDISRMFNSVHRAIGSIRLESLDVCGKERRLAESVSSALASAIQALFLEFRAAQSSYLNRLKTREEASKACLSVVDFDLLEEGTRGTDEDVWRGPTEAQAFLEQSTIDVQHRQKEVETIFNSILELNTLFKDLSLLVVDQGTVLDRIDYNVESTQVQVAEGVRSLQKAAKYQRGNKKMMCILCLSSVTLVLIVTLIVVKT